MIHCRGNLICRPAVMFLPVMIFWLAGQLLPLMRRHFWMNVNMTIKRSKCEERAEGMYSGRPFRDDLCCNVQWEARQDHRKLKFDGSANLLTFELGTAISPRLALQYSWSLC